METPRGIVGVDGTWVGGVAPSRTAEELDSMPGRPRRTWCATRRRSCRLLLGPLAVLLGCLPLARVRAAWALDNGLALTPYMGWNSYYGRTPLYEKNILAVADAMVNRGLLAAGYQ